MSLLDRPIARPLIGIVAVASAVLTATASAGPDEHKFHSDQIFLSSRSTGPIEQYMITVETRSGSLDIAPHGVPLPEWARKVKHNKFDPKAEVLVIARNFAEKRDVAGHGSIYHQVRRDGEFYRTEWPEHFEEEDLGSFGTHYVIRVPTLGGVDAKTGLGPIRIDRARGDVKAKTGLGPISAERLEGDTDLKTGQGLIAVVFAEAHAGHATVKSGLGPLTVSGAKWADAKTSQGSIEVSLAEHPADDIVLKTALGSITLEMPDGTDAFVEASTAMGSISIDGLDSGRDHSAGAMQKMQTILGKGGVRITCTTHQGSISIDG